MKSISLPDCKRAKKLRCSTFLSSLSTFSYFARGIIQKDIEKEDVVQETIEDRSVILL